MVFMSMLKVTVAQFEIAVGDMKANFENCLYAVWQAAAAGSQVLQLPELWYSGYDLANCQQHYQETIAVSEQMQKLADEYHLAIGGSYITARDNHFFNSYLLFLPGRTAPVRYDKTHLFRLLDEQKAFTPGDQLAVVDLGGCKAGLAICYDARFPELIRAYAHRQIDLLLVAAQWGKPRADHWRTLLKARSIENQIFVAAANGIGPILDQSLAGYSVILDPWGNILTEASSDQPAILTASLDMDEIQRVRKSVPSGEDQRPDLYRKWEATLVHPAD